MRENDWTTIFNRIYTHIRWANLCLCADSNARREETKQENSIDLGERLLESALTMPSAF